MNKLLTGLLIAAAGTAAFFVFRNKNTDPEAAMIKKEFIIGKWETISDTPADSMPTMQQYEFLDNGIMVKAGIGSLKADTAYFIWDKADQLLWKKDTSDTSAKTFLVTKLTADSLILRSADSTSHLFTKLK